MNDIVSVLTNFQDAYTLGNEGAASFNYTITRLTCEEDVVVFQGSIAPNQIVAFNFIEDGLYRFYYYNDGANSTSDIGIYSKLANSFIKSTKKILCGCKCDDCNCSVDCDEIACTLPRATAYYTLNNLDSNNNNYYQLFFDAIVPFFQCRLAESVSCSYTNEIIRAEYKCLDVIENTIMIYYLTFFYYEYNYAIEYSSVEQQAFIKTKYSSVEVLSCIRKKGINLTEIIAALPEIGH